MSDPKSAFKQSIADKLKKHLPGKKSALEAPKDPKSMTSEDAHGRRTWDNAGFAALAETRLKKWVFLLEVEIFASTDERFEILRTLIQFQLPWKAR